MEKKTIYAIEYQSKSSQVKENLTCVSNLDEVKKYILIHHKSAGKRYRKINRTFKWLKNWKYSLKNFRVDKKLDEFITKDNKHYIPCDAYMVTFRSREKNYSKEIVEYSEYYFIYKVDLD